MVELTFQNHAGLIDKIHSSTELYCFVYPIKVIFKFQIISYELYQFYFSLRFL